MVEVVEMDGTVRDEDEARTDCAWSKMAAFCDEREEDGERRSLRVVRTDA